MIGLKQFRTAGCLSYLTFDRASALAALVDPAVELMDSYRSYLAENRLKLTAILDTHTHADHYSASHLLKAEHPSAEIGMSDRSGSLRATRKLRQGDVIRLGEYALEVLETPGHTPDSLCFRGPGLVLTGDTLFIGSTGRTDFPGADPAQQWNSLHQILGKLPDATLVYPGHDYNDRLFTTIGHERKSNPHWLIPSQEAFVTVKNAEVIATAQSGIRERIEFNLDARPTREVGGRGVGAATACGVSTTADERLASIGVEKFHHKVQEKAAGTLFVDVREPDEFAEGHVPGARNIPLSELGLQLPDLLSARRVYVYCQSGMRSLQAAKTLNYLGLPDVVNVSGGFSAWTGAGHSVAR